MSTDRDVTRIVRSWLEEGVTTLPDRVLDGVLDQLPATPQRRARWPAWRLNTMATPIRIAVAAAAISVLAVVVGIVPKPGQYGGPNSPASPSPLPSPIPFGGPGALLPGRYQGPLGDGQWTVTAPAGWEWFYEILWKDLDGRADYTKLGGPGEVAFIWWPVDNVFHDPCHWKGSLIDPPVGPTANDLATAFVEQVGRDGSGPTDVMLAGYPAKKVELSVPADLDVSTCDEGVYREFLEPGQSLTLPDGYSTPDMVGLVTDLYILDIDGARYMMRTWHRLDASPENLAEMEAMLESIVIEMPAPSPSPSS